MVNYPSAEFSEQAEKPIDYKYYFFLFIKNFYVIFTFLIITVTLVSIYESKLPELYQTTAQLMVERPRTNWQNVDKQAQSTETEGYQTEYYLTQMEIMTNQAVLRQVVEELKLAKYFSETQGSILDNDHAVEMLKTMVTVKRIGQSRLINISVKGKDPKLVANIANVLARAYVRRNFEEQLYYSKEVLNWLPSNGDPKEMITITSPMGGVKQMSREELIESLPSIKGDATIKELHEKKASMESELTLNLKRYREKHPVIVKNRANLKFLGESVQQEKARIVETLKAQAEGQHQIATARIIQEARIPERPESQGKWKIILIAALAEIVLCFIIIAIFDHFDDTVHSFDDLERKGLTLPFLGPLPLIRTHKGDPSRKALAGYYDKASGIAESFRYLRVAINFSATPEALKTLVFTSCLPHEGKSFCSHNIAVSLAQDGNKTLLIDADMRRPTLDRVFKLDNTTGLSNYLTSNLEHTSVLKETFMENLLAITSGPMSPNPGELLASERMKKLVDKCRGEFDRIIIDCPPLIGIGDGLIVGSLIGHLILVIAAGKTPADLIRHTQSQIERSKVKLIGIILNMVDMDKERHRGYSKHYYHTYNRYYQVSEGSDKKS
jgi:capsular exopolysaccharide synthesis family protein